ncbi:odorant receptor 46a-like [Pararge aegeria]|uniref:odorant receptor 46a-like n=1 Tax=Pararge aegeria TaxID=116150 RepID=UPI0019D00FF7|nr:odorant receptor 46a-like [Pararge aegeria]
MIFLKPTDCFNKNLKFWKLLGIYPFKVNWKFYEIYSIIFVFLFIFLYDGLITITFFYLPRDLDHFVDEMIFYFTVLAVMSKVVTYMLAKEKMCKIFEILDSETFQPESKKGLQIITKAKKFNVKYWKIVASVSYYSNLVHILTPFIAHIFSSVPLLLNLSNYSFLSDDFIEKYIYPIYFYQGIGMHINMLYNLNIDTFFLGLMVFAIAQLELLEDKLITITDESNAKTHEHKLNSTKSATDDTILITKLNKAIIHYYCVDKFCSLIEQVFSVTLFVQFSMASCIICVCLFRFTLPATAEYYMFLASYISIMIVQIMVPCWFGTRIMDKSSLLSQAIYTCDWTARSRRFKSSLKLFVERANRPLSITGWKMFPLSLNTFTSIMNSAYSFFTLLRHMQSREI